MNEHVARLVWTYPEGHEAHVEAGHPERPERIEALRKTFEQHGWWQTYPKLDPVEFPDSVLYAVHSADYLARLQAASRRGAHLDADTYTTTHSWDLARRSAGQAIGAAHAVWSGAARRGFALTRPPGHHATADRGMGFCLLNNVALAAEYLLQVAGARRLAILDFDLHHGNGTQDIFWQRGDVFYLSTHQSPLYPGSGRIDETGRGEGAMTTANLPLPPGSGDGALREIAGEFVLPLLERFGPEMLLVSFGFDIHWRDPLGSLLVSAHGYGELMQTVVSWAEQHCQGRVCLVLEGGYDLEAAAACGSAAVSALLEEEFLDPLGAAPWPEFSGWQAVLERARKVWGM